MLLPGFLICLAVATTVILVNRAGMPGDPRSMPASGSPSPRRDFRTIVERINVLPDTRLKKRSLGRVKYRAEVYPVILLSFPAATGTSEQTRVLLTAGIHGNEPAGSEALLRLSRQLARETWRYGGASIDIVPVVNPWGWVHNTRHNGAGLDINRDFASDRTQEARLLKDFITANGPYDIVLDLHESTKPGYFMYRYGHTEDLLVETYRKLIMEMNVPVERTFREALFKAKDGIISVPGWSLHLVRVARRLAFDHYVRLEVTKQAYTLETPLRDRFDTRMRVHYEAVSSFLRVRTSWSEPASLR